MNDSPWRQSSAVGLKEPSVRAPDPEHLKAVWSSTSDKALLPAVNSLEAMDDDLTGLPFTLQEVKSEDGSTPPPSGPPPSRMSLHDVTRAFQQVPPMSASERPASISPAVSNMSGFRPPPYTYTNAQHNNAGVRPGYGAYASPIVAQSSPNLVYTHPLTPTPVNGAGTLGVHGQMPSYGGQAVWMPTGQSPNGVLRPIPPSPYHTQAVHYGSPGSHAPYHAQVSSGGRSQSFQSGASPAVRGRGVPISSPSMPRAMPVTTVPYGPSGVVSHNSLSPAQSFLPPQTPTRGPPRGESTVISPQHAQPITSHSRPSPYFTGYTPVEGNTFPRATW
jgi:hypothetical protein